MLHMIIRKGKCNFACNKNKKGVEANHVLIFTAKDKLLNKPDYLRTVLFCHHYLLQLFILQLNFYTLQFHALDIK